MNRFAGFTVPVRLRRDGETLSTARDAAERILRKGRMIPVEHR
ncbi:hypothetical protein [Mesorhizobium sp. M1A.F.Ca.IN.022.07.1.1]|nr:hypothetical protein [Mesorhizobium sp. M1A.F.Ca.IN.022.07.1.1]